MKIVMLTTLLNKCHDVSHHPRIVHGFAIPWGCLYCRKNCLNVFEDVQGKVKYFCSRICNLINMGRSKRDNPIHFVRNLLHEPLMDKHCIGRNSAQSSPSGHQPIRCKANIRKKSLLLLEHRSVRDVTNVDVKRKQGTHFEHCHCLKVGLRY